MLRQRQRGFDVAVFGGWQVLTQEPTTPRSIQPEKFAAALQKAGLPGKPVILPGVDHSWIGKTPAVTQYASKEALRKTVDFFESVIGDSAAGKP